jgi:hypothetical protein
MPIGPSNNSNIASRVRALHNATFFRQARKVKILTGGIHWVFRGLNFEACRRITGKWQLCKALRVPKPTIDMGSNVSRFVIAITTAKTR